MKKITVIGKTEATINLNKIGVPIKGKSIAILDITNDECERELDSLIKMGLLEIVNNVKENEKNTQENSNGKRRGRPKGSKGKNIDNIIENDSLAEEERKQIAKAEAKTQKEGSNVVLGTMDGPKKGRMTRSAVNDIVENENTKASVKAMEKIEQEEKDNIFDFDDDTDEQQLPVSDQTGRKAVVVNEGVPSESNMVNSIVPESDKIRKSDPFIDRKEQQDKQDWQKNASTDAFIDNNDDDEGYGDAFIEI